MRSKKYVAMTADKLVCSIDGCNNAIIVADVVDNDDKTLPCYLERGDITPTEECLATS